MTPLDADEVAEGLWQGSAPPIGPELARRGFGALVLCAEEYQPRAGSFPGLRVFRAPMVDGPLEPEQAMLASKAALFVVDQLQAGRRTIVTCLAGMNRSGLVAAIACHYVTGAPGIACVEYVRQKRPEALSNGYFVAFLRTLPPRQAILKKR